MGSLPAYVSKKSKQSQSTAFRRLSRKLKKLKNKLDRGEIEFADIRQSYASWKGSLKGKKCYKTIQSMDELFNKLFINDWRLNYEY